MPSCYCPKVPDNIKPFVSNCDKLLFTGTYNVNDANYGDGDTVDVNISCLQGDFSVMNVPSVSFNSIPQDPSSVLFLTEVYNLTTWSPNLINQIGFISWTNSYPNPGTSNNVTSIPIVSFAVSAKSGFYSKVDKVIIDYTNQIRVMYFFKKSKH